jgi:hypothetical protein
MLLVSHTDTVEAQPTFYAQLTTLARQLEQEATNEGKKRPQAAEGSPETNTAPFLGAAVRNQSKWRGDRDSLQTIKPSSMPWSSFLWNPAGGQARRRAAGAIRRM